MVRKNVEVDSPDCRGLCSWATANLPRQSHSGSGPWSLNLSTRKFFAQGAFRGKGPEPLLFSFFASGRGLCGVGINIETNLLELPQPILKRGRKLPAWKS